MLPSLVSRKDRESRLFTFIAMWRMLSWLKEEERMRHTSPSFTTEF